jgi:hypothetical protein
MGGPWEDFGGSAESSGDVGPWTDFAPAPKEKPKVVAPPATAKERVLATEGGANKGVAGLLGLPVDTVTNVMNLVIAGHDLGEHVASGDAFTGKALEDRTIKKPFLGSEHITEIMNTLGFQTDNPRPDDAASRMLHTGAQVAASAITPAKGQSTLGLAKSGIAPGVGGAVASEALGPEWAGVGAMTPAAVGKATVDAKRAVAERVQPNIKTFEDVGAQPSLGQATENPFIQGLENVMSRFPGGAGVMRRFAEKQQAAMGETATTDVGADTAGRAIKAGVDKFIDRTKSEWNKLDAETAAKMPQGLRVKPAATSQALDELTQPVKGAEASTAEPLDARVTKIKKDLETDLAANNGAISYDGLRVVRSRVGAQLDDALVQGAKAGELERLYGALSKDLEGAANAIGAGKEFKRQNDYYRARMDRIRGALDEVIGKERTPEDVFANFMPKNVDQVTKVSRVMRSLPPDERRVVSEAVVDRMGRATPGQQTEFGDKFSSESFLTNWNKMNDKAKAQIFPDGEMREKMESLATASANIREGSKIFANPGGTTQSLAAHSIYSSPVTAAAAFFVGGPVAAAGVLATAGAAVGGANITARMLTSQRVLDWLAKAPTMKEQNIPAHLQRLAVIYNETDDSTLKDDLAKYMDSLSSRVDELPQPKKPVVNGDIRRQAPDAYRTRSPNSSSLPRG